MKSVLHFPVYRITKAVNEIGLLIILLFTLSCTQKSIGTETNEISNNKEIEQPVDSEYKMHIDHSCSFVGELNENSVLAFSSDYEADNAVARIMKLTGLSPNFVIKSSSVPNASAVIKVAPSGELIRYILYNQEFMERIKVETKTNFAEMAVLAHEIGHHLNGHTLNNGTNRQDIELEADKFAGFILYKLKASIEEANKAYSNLPIESTSTHPPKADRLAALSSGWYDAKRNGETQMSQPGVSKEPNTTSSLAPDSKDEIINKMEKFMNANLSSSAGNLKLSFDTRGRVLRIGSAKIPLNEVSIFYENNLKLDAITLQLHCYDDANCIYFSHDNHYALAYGIILDHEDQYDRLEKWIKELKR